MPRRGLGFRSRELEEDMDYHGVAGTQRGPVSMEILPVQEEISLPSDGILCLCSQGSSRDSETEHGIDLASCLPKHHNQAQINSSQLSHPI